jgi:hypothetical protein
MEAGRCVFLNDKLQGFAVRLSALRFGSILEGPFVPVFVECHTELLSLSLDEPGSAGFCYDKASAIKISARLLCDLERKINYMAPDKHKKGKDPVASAHDQAEKDMEKDPELSDPDPTDDLDEGELARRDNSDEEALDYLERPRHQQKDHPVKSSPGHSEKGKKK